MSTDHVRAGRQGEIAFAWTLQRAGLLSQLESFWSLYVPDADGTGLPQAGEHAEADLDCALLVGNQVWLFDVKQWSQTSTAVLRLGGTMPMLYDRISRLLPDSVVRSFVVFGGDTDPSDLQAQPPANTTVLRAEDAVAYLENNRRFAGDPVPDPRAVRLFLGLVKPHGSSAHFSPEVTRSGREARVRVA